MRLVVSAASSTRAMQQCAVCSVLLGARMGKRAGWRADGRARLELERCEQTQSSWSCAAARGARGCELLAGDDGGLRAAWGVGREPFYAYSRRTAPPAETAHRSCSPRLNLHHVCPAVAAAAAAAATAGGGGRCATALSSSSSCSCSRGLSLRRPHAASPANTTKNMPRCQRKHTETPAAPSLAAACLASNQCRHGEFASHTCRRRP